MSRLIFGPVSFDADLVIFDKDGTLTDFEFMWGRLALAWARRLVEHLGDADLEADLHHSLGHDAQDQRTLPGSPLVSGSAEKLQTIVAAVLYRHGIPWPDAENIAQSTFAVALQDWPPRAHVRAVGDVKGLVARLRATEVRVAVVTVDSREGTAEVLHDLGIAGMVDAMVCGDDGLSWKPSPEMLLAACGRLRIDPQRAAMVGDTQADMLMASQAGAGLRVAVLSGVGDPAKLAFCSDVVLGSIDDIDVDGSPE